LGSSEASIAVVAEIRGGRLFGAEVGGLGELVLKQEMLDLGRSKQAALAQLATTARMIDTAALDCSSMRTAKDLGRSRAWYVFR
jgi:hypothetical protein